VVGIVNMRDTRVLGFSLLLLLGCYQPRALEVRTLVAELAAEQPRPKLPASEGDGPAGDGLSADEAVEWALKANPDLRALRGQTAAAEGEVMAAGALSNPTLELQLLHVQKLGSDSPEWSAELGWEPPQPVIRSARRAAARSGVEAVRSEIAEQEWELAAQVRAAHATLLAAAEHRVLVEQALVTRKQIAELVGKRVSGGFGTKLDSSLAELAVSQVEHERDEAIARELLAGRQLAELMGETHPLRATGTIPDDASPPGDLVTLTQAALAGRPSVEGAKARYQAREEQVRAEYARRWPWFRFTAIPRYRADDSENHAHDLMLGIQLSLPFLDQNTGPIQVAEATRDQERERVRKLVSSIQLEIEAARQEVLIRQESLRRFRESVLPGLKSHEELLASAASGGQLDVVAVLTAEDVILRSRREYVDLRLAHHLAWLALERAVGPPR
jgi:cobalt-zinc-cadmium efflux system outer membrane protein